MSAGRGTPRVGPFQGDLPDLARIQSQVVAPLSTVSITGVSNALWMFKHNIVRQSPFLLSAAGGVYNDGDARETFPIPLGAKRGLISGTYTGAVTGGQLGIRLQWGESQAYVTQLADPVNFTFPAANTQEVVTTLFVPELAPVPMTNSTPQIFRIPFWVPPIGDVEDGDVNLETPFIPVRMYVREIGGAPDGESSVVINMLVADNLGEAFPVASE